ncbi:MAG: HNH endonuclease [Bryobacterales bacterium]|nr:HNH endonuclease [Bryobacterales bacterium]
MQPWERSTNRKLPGGWADPSDLPQGPNGRALCRWCRLEVPKGRRTFCSDWCVREWKIRSDAGYLRSLVFNRDHGICAVCALDTIEAFRRLKRSRGERRKALLLHWGLTRLHRSSLWDADHILPVADGGGECDLENIRTLCLRCHRQATFHLRARRVGKVYSG